MTTATNTQAFEWAGDTYDLPSMNEQALNELYDRIIDWWAGIDDRFEAGTVKPDWHGRETLRVKTALAAIEAEFERRESLPEPPAPKSFEIPLANRVIVDVLSEYSAPILTRVEREIRRRGLKLTEFSYSGKNKTSRLGAAWELATRGGWNLPVGPGQPFLIDSGRAGAGNLAYQVYVQGVPGHGGNQCACEDHIYSRINTGGLCKHVLAGLILFYASMAFKSEYGEIGRKVA